MRTGADYRASLRDGRRVWLLGEGPVDDVTSHPAMSAMVDFYADWYDRHRDPAWQDVLLTPAGAGERRPLAFEIPRSADDLRRLGKAIHAVAFRNAGNVTHTPGYGALIALGVLDAVIRMGAPADRIAAAAAYRDMVARSERFVTFASGAPVPADRFRGAGERVAVRLLGETDGGVVVGGMAGLHTAVPFAEEVVVTAGMGSRERADRIWFSVPVNAEGVRVVARRTVAGQANGAVGPLSARFDELDAQLWLDNVFIPWDRVFALRFEPSDSATGRDDARRRDGIVSWLLWHQQLGWLAWADFTLGLALAVADAMGLTGIQGVVDSLMELVIDAETIRAAVTAAELNPELTPAGYLHPRLLHLAPAALRTFQTRQRMAEILRNLMGQAGVLIPTAGDLADGRIAADLETAFGGGGYTAQQRTALLQLAWDHVSSALDAREAAFESLANGGVPVWRHRLQRWFDRYDELANGVLAALDLEMPRIDLDHLRDVAPLRRGASLPPEDRPAPPSG